MKNLALNGNSKIHHKKGLHIFSTSPSDPIGVELAKSYCRERGLTPKDVSIRKYEGAVSVEVK